MTETEINIAIAEKCGLKELCDCEHSSPSLSMCDVCRGRLRPNYCRNLNVMHEAETTLNQFERDTFLDYLEDDAEQYDEDERWHVCNANARQRAEAFLKTVGGWKS